MPYTPEMAVSVGQRPVMAAGVVATVASAFPAFLTGALTVQVSADFDVGEAIYGWALGSYFLAAACGSVVLGRLAQRVGPRRQIMAALAVVGLAQLYVAASADTFFTLVIAIAVCGLANAGNQTAVNLALTQAKIRRLGLAVAMKQSGMPSASLLGGLMVPAVALTVGWRWAYVAGSILALLSGVFVSRVIGHRPRVDIETPVADRQRSTFAVLAAAAVAGGLLAFGAGALNAWLVSSGVDAGMSEAVAGLMLSAGAAMGIAARMVFGFRLDRLVRSPFHLAGMILPIGVLGVAMLTVRSPLVHVAATALAFVGGWTWPVFTNFGIVRANAGSAGSATGITQMGVYVGVFSAPLITGFMIERFGYGPMWLLVAAVMAAGTAVTVAVGNRF